LEQIEYFHYFQQIEYFHYLHQIEYFHYSHHVEYFHYFHQMEYFHYFDQIISTKLTISVNSVESDILMHFLNFGFRLFESDITKLPHREGPCAHARILSLEQFI
jgi:hypothetical protein